MKKLFMLFILVAANATAHTEQPSVEDLIDQLTNTREDYFGFSALYDGFQFFPRPDDAGWTTGITGPNSPPPLGPILTIVQRGAAAIPILVAHLDDKRPTKVQPLTDFYQETNDEYDYNKRTRAVAPEGVNRASSPQDDPIDPPPPHQVTVGDLCFVALGQIVNRNFNPTRGQPSGGLIINSPTSSPRLLAVIKADYGDMIPKRHKEQLIEDFRKPDSEYRRNAAIARLAYYYPEELDTLVFRQLKVPTYNARNVDSFLRVLDSEKSLGKRKQLLNAYLAKHGPAYRDGIILRLFVYLGLPVRLYHDYDAGGLLIQLFGYTQKVTKNDAPYLNTWDEDERADFIEALGPTTHPLINAEVYRLFSENKRDSYLALQFVKALLGTGHDKELIDYCKHHLGGQGAEADGFRQLLNQLTKRT